MSTEWRSGYVTIPGVIPVIAADINGVRWNGWVVPRFTREAAEQVAKASVEKGDYESWEWENDCLVMTFKPEASEDDEASMWTPDPDGKYQVGAYEWTWEEVVAV